MTRTEMIKKVNEFLKENDFGYGVYEGWRDNIANTGDFDIEMDIEWGDWKHEHLRANYLVREALKDERVYITWNEKITEQDGSDCYSAHHTWTIFQY